MTISDGAIRARQENNPNHIIEQIPYARLLGMTSISGETGLTYSMPAQKGIVGNPRLQAIHGGALGGFMEMSATLHLLMTMSVLKLPKVVDFSIDYLRAGLMKDTHASCEIIREGRKLANVHIEAWQDRRDSLIARARVHFLLD